MKPVSAINRLLNRIQGRFRRARSGSVLILVVALLVLMALLGTAFISTARIDRYSAVINSANTEIDLLVQGVINMAMGTVVDDLYDPTPNATFGMARDYRKPPLDGPGVTGAYEHHDSPAIDQFLASRLPEVLNLLDPVAPGTNPPTWHGVTWPLAPRADGTFWFDRPGAASIQLTLAKSNYAFSPTFVATPGQLWPALQIWTRAADGTWGAGAVLRAADADGDGFADAGLWKIPVGTIDGITYYAAARIIDNNSAINVNTALSRSMDFDAAFTGTNSAMFYPSRVGLGEMVKTYNPTATTFATFATEMLRMNTFRFNSVLPALATPVRDDGTAPAPDFDYGSLGDALNSQIARRVKFPGRNTAALPFQTYGIGESMTLAYCGGLRNPNVSPSLLEQHLLESLVTGVPVPGQYAQTAAAVLLWYGDIYDYDQETQIPTPVPSTFKPLRSLLVASNPVANQALATYDRADLNGDGLRNDLPAGLAPQMAPYVPAPAQPANPPKVSINTAAFADLYRAFWNVMVDEVEDPVGSGTIRKAAPVEETVQLFDTTAGNRDARMDPYYGQRFDMLPPYTAIPAEQNPSRMFRSPLRDTRVPVAGPGGVNRMLPYEVLKLRAAIAAVNAMDLRDSDNDLSEQSITVNVIEDNTLDTIQATTTARVFGTEAQPYITEVYANLHNGPTVDGINPNGYVAIELSNPYPFPIPLRPAGSTSGWSVGLIDRNPVPAKTQLTIVPIDDVAGAINPVWKFPEGTIVPAATAAGPGKLVLENYSPPGGLADPTAATYRPEGARAGGLPAVGVSPTIATVFVSRLHRVFATFPATLQTGGEFVLLRPRAGSGIAVDASGSGGPNELLNLYDLVPVDSFDFSGMSKDFLSLAPPYLWMHYVRENGPGFDWRFVYPGRYDASANAATPTNTNARHQGVQMILFGEPAGPAPTELDILPQKPVALGAVDPVAPAATHYTNPFTIQIANTDFGGHNKIGAAGAPTPPQFPFGAFARNGDILQVPFIGAYVIDSPDAGAGPDAFLEMNSLPMDSVFAEDTDTSNDPVILGTPDTGVQDREQIGRFYPLERNVNTGTLPAAQTDDFRDGIASANAPTTYNLAGEYWNFTQTGDNPLIPTTHVPQWRYRWAMDILEHLTVEAPHDDYFPNIAKTTYGTVQPVSNSGSTAGDSTVVALKDVEAREPVEGLININTASWKVLSALPLVLSNGAGTPATPNSGPAPGTAGQVFPGMTSELAKVIVYYRDVDADPFTAGNQPHGPFRTIMELNKVVDTRPAALGGPVATTELNLRPGFRNAMGTLVFTGTSATDINDPQGDFSPLTPAAADNVRADFEEKSLALSRISNLITTRSDSFTCYVLVQGYRDAESTNPELVVQRRVAFLLDRSGTVPAFSQPLVTKVPNN